MGIPTYHTNLLEFDGMVNLMKGAIETADRITTVSPTYAKRFSTRGIPTAWIVLWCGGRTALWAFSTALTWWATIRKQTPTFPSIP